MKNIGIAWFLFFVVSTGGKNNWRKKDHTGYSERESRKGLILVEKKKIQKKEEERRRRKKKKKERKKEERKKEEGGIRYLYYIGTTYHSSDW